MFSLDPECQPYSTCARPVALVQWSFVGHFAAVGAIFAGLFVHVCMGAVLAEERPAVFSMFTGKVPELYAYRHHCNWWRQHQDRATLARQVARGAAAERDAAAVVDPAAGDPGAIEERP